MIKRKSKHEFRVQLEIKPYTHDDLQEVLQWCKDNFGEGGRNKRCIWRYGWVHRYADTFYFKFEKDALLFCMRWL